MPFTHRGARNSIKFYDRVSQPPGLRPPAWPWRGRNEMARKSSHPEVSRRKFLAGVAVAGAASTVAAPSADAAAPPVAAAKIPSVLRPTAQQIAAETELPKVDSPLGGRAGSDFMIDVIKSLGIEYCYANPASSYRGIHESLINYGKN